MNDGVTDQAQTYFIPASPEKLNAHRQSFCITELSPFVLVEAAVASLVSRGILICSIVW